MEQLFKLYDIRGVYPAELNEDFAYKLGRTVAVYFTGEQIVIGRDCRAGSERLARALIEGVIAQGTNVLDIGICSTPMATFAAQEHPAVMVTASHHPKEFNGFKICAKGGMPLGFPDGLSVLKRLLEHAEFGRPKHKGKVRKHNLLKAYVAHVRQFKSKIKKIKLVIDAGNGVQGIMAPKVFGRLPAKIIPLFFEPDGNFPNRNPDPLVPGALTALSKAVVHHRANLGVAFDGDGDCVVFIDERGRAVRPDHLLSLLAQHLLKHYPHAKVLYDACCSRVVKEQVTALRGVPVMTRAGRSYIMQVMKEEEARIAGELSGHYYFRENFCADSGDIPVLLLLNLLSEERRPLSKLLAPLQKYANSGELSFAVEHPDKTLKKVEEFYGEKGKIYHIDGLSVEFPDWWFNLRQSQAESALKLNVEAKTKALLDRKIAELKKLVS
jgi:phosphomannomutase